MIHEKQYNLKDYYPQEVKQLVGYKTGVTFAEKINFKENFNKGIMTTLIIPDNYRVVSESFYEGMVEDIPEHQHNMVSTLLKVRIEPYSNKKAFLKEDYYNFITNIYKHGKT